MWCLCVSHFSAAKCALSTCHPNCNSDVSTHVRMPHKTYFKPNTSPTESFYNACDCINCTILANVNRNKTLKRRHTRSQNQMESLKQDEVWDSINVGISFKRSRNVFFRMKWHRMVFVHMQTWVFECVRVFCVVFHMPCHAMPCHGSANIKSA